jgi:hypothetical protein
MRLIRLLALSVVLICGCAHRITIEPDIGKLALVPKVSQPIPIDVGYVIPPEASSLEVTTQGGGGDNVRYFPYRDIEPGFQSMLRNVFVSVEKMSSISANNPTAHIDYVIVPTIVTSSGGSGLFTWPPTNFTVDLTCTIRDPAGVLVASPRVVGTGSAETGERLRDHAIAGRRAIEDALVKMQAAMLEVKFPSALQNGSGHAQPPVAVGEAANRLNQLKELRDKGLISGPEYDAKRKAILDSL